MKITILNGDMNPENRGFTEYINKLEKELSIGNSVERYDLNSMNLKYCTGCWSCWWKTPGECATKDDGEIILRSVINSEFLIFASPLMQGFTSSSLKKITDRFVSLLHPYVILVNGECHHKKRYASYPDFGVIISKEEDTDDEEIKIVGDIYDRFANNFHCKKKYIKNIESVTIEDLAYETCNN